MAQRVTIGPPGSILDWDNWGKPVTDAINEFDTYINGSWVSYATPTLLQASVSNPTQGNSIYQAEYFRSGARWINVRFRIQIGSTFTAGSGNYRIMLPFAASAGSSNSMVGAMWVNDSGLSLRTGLVTLDGQTAYATLWYNNAAASIVVLTNTGPGSAWATNDAIVGNFGYEPA